MGGNAWDALKDKLKGKKKFKGQAHRADSSPSPQAGSGGRQPQGPPGRQEGEPSGSGGGGGGGGAGPSGSNSSRLLGQGRRLGSAADNKPPPRQSIPSRAAPPPVPSPPKAPPAPPKGPYPGHYPGDVSVMEQAVATYLSSAPAPSTPEVLLKVLRNILASPEEAKFRKLRLANARVKDTIVDVEGGLDILQECGFDLVFDESASEGEPLEGSAVLALGADLEKLRAAAWLLSPHSEPEASSSGQANLRQPPGPQRRNTQVLMPVEVEGEVADWVFQRTPNELKVAFSDAQRKRSLQQTVMLKSTRDRLLGINAPGPPPPQGVFRVRMPEGLLLQGEFGSGEALSAVREWVAECLRDPAAEFALARADRQAMPADSVLLRNTDMLPSMLLHFRPGQGCSTDPQNRSMLRADLLQNTKSLES